MTITTIKAGQVGLLGLLGARGAGQVAAQLDAISTSAAQPTGISPLTGRPIGRSSVFRGVAEHAFASLDVTVFGRGAIGDKARGLIVKTAEIRASGFHTPRRYVIAQSLLDEYCRRNGFGQSLGEAASRGAAPETMLEGHFTMELIAVIERIVHEHRGWPIMVRSSASGDARGSGIFTSKAVRSTIREIKDAVRVVLGSYFSNAARAFRRKASLSNGFGILIEPMVAHDFGHRFAPIISGFGYSSTAKNGGYVLAVPGLGGGVETRNGETITREHSGRLEGSLYRYVLEQRKAWSQRLSQCEGGGAISALALGVYEHLYEAESFMPYKKGWGVHDDLLSLKGWMRDIDLSPLFDGVARLERRFGVPQYFEWAFTVEHDEPRWSILQVADVSSDIDRIEFGIAGDEALIVNEVTNSGIRCCTKTVICTSQADVDRLKGFNAEHHGYIMLYSGELVSARDEDEQILTFDTWSNAGVVIEIPDAAHNKSAIGHMGGACAMTGKLFGVIDRFPRDSVLRPWYEKQFIDRGGFAVFEHPFMVVADERRDRLVLADQP